MRRILIFSNTFYQIIMAIQMRLTLLSNDYVSLVISDHSNGAHNVCKALKGLQIFNECAFIQSKGIIHERTKSEKVREYFQIILSKRNRYAYYLEELSSLYYDELLSYNLEIDTYGVFSILAEYNPKLEYASYEEGVLSYENFFYDSLKFKSIRFFRKILGKANLFDFYTKFYCIYPEVYKGFLETVKIPTISVGDIKLKEILCEIFDVKSKIDYKSYKYIFFESIYATEGRAIGEDKILLWLANIVGKENILIKKHPRSTDHFFEENGFTVDTNSIAPFEILQLNYDMSNCIFVAATSGSVLSINSVVDKPSHVLMFYPLTDYKKDPNLCMFAKHVETVINQFHSMDKMEHIHIIRSLNEMLCMITELQGKRADSYGKPIQIFTKECRNFDNK